MRKLTSKNYELLPEVQKAKADQLKKEEFKSRMKQVKELESKRKELLKGKKPSWVKYYLLIIIQYNVSLI